MNASRTTSKVVLFVLFSFYLTLFLLSAAETKLLLIDQYPRNEKDTYFKSLVDLLAVENKYIFAVDNFGHRILKFVIESGRIGFLNSIGRKGQGPGDLQLPNRISFNDRELCVKDGNGFSFFNQDGKYQNKFKTFTANYNFVYLNKKIYWLNANPDDHHLIEVLTADGELVDWFGEKFLNIDFSIHKLFNPFHIEQILYDGNILTDTKSIYYVNNTFCEIEKYGEDGQVLYKKNISGLFSELGKAIIKENRRVYLEEGLKITDGGYREYPRYFVFKDACLVYPNLYFLCHDHMPGAKAPDSAYIIKVMNIETLMLTKEYRIDKRYSPEDRAICFTVLEENAGPILILCVHSQEGCTLDLYR